MLTRVHRLSSFSVQREQAAAFMADHKAWIDQGIEDGVFLLVGSLQPNGGGAVLAHGVSRADLERRVTLEPKVDERLRLLVEAP